MKKKMNILWITVLLSMFCLTGCVVAPQPVDDRHERERPVYRDDSRPVVYTVDIRDIEQRIAVLDQRIDIGLRNKVLTRDEGRLLSLELQKVKEDLIRAQRDGRITLREKDRLSADLDRLERNIYREVRDDNRHRPVLVDIRDIEQRIDVLDQRINVGLRNKTLTRDEGRLLRLELQKVKDDAAGMKRDGRITPRDKDRLSAHLDRLEKNIHREARDVNRPRPVQVDISDLEQRITNLNRQIDMGLRSKALTPVQGKSLRTELKKVRDEAARLKKESRMTKIEKDRLSADLDRLQAGLEHEKPVKVRKR
jgi:hypothetical protein